VGSNPNARGKVGDDHFAKYDAGLKTHQSIATAETIEFIEALKAITRGQTIEVSMGYQSRLAELQLAARSRGIPPRQLPHSFWTLLTVREHGRSVHAVDLGCSIAGGDLEFSEKGQTGVEVP
jgi:hypothetical protein